MAAIRLREPSVLALIFNVIVLAVVLPGALAADNATWIRIGCLLLAAIALVLGVRSAIILARR